MSTLPAFTESDVRQRVGTKSFDRGQRYFHDGMIFDAQRQGRTLKAACHGSMPEPYYLHVTFDDGGITEADCSCPVGSGGSCKHVAALLLTWLDDPEAFTETAPLDEALQQRSKDDLIRLIGQMVDRHPDLEGLVAMPPPGTAQEPLKPNVIDRQVNRIFAGDLYEWGSAYRVGRELERLVRLGEAYAQHGDWASVVALCQPVIDAIMGHYEMLHDENGDVAMVVNDCVSYLGRGLQEVRDDALRRDIIHTLYEVITWNIALGGFDIGYEAEDFFRDHTTPAERRLVCEWVEHELSKIKLDDSWSAGWRNRQLGALLLALQDKDELDDETYLKICRSSGRTLDLVGRLLQLGRLDEALDAVRNASDYDLLQSTDLFLQHSHGEAIDAVVLERLDASTDRRLVEWLKDRARERGDASLAQRLAEQLFWVHPSVEHYDEIIALARTLGREDAVRTALHERLRKEKACGILAEVLLHEGEPEEALKLVHLPYQEWGWYGRSREALRLDVARALETIRPEEALHLYLDAVTARIEQRGRENYAEAARLLQRVRTVYRNRGKDDDWQLLIQEIRDANPRLRALKEELKKAGL